MAKVKNANRVRIGKLSRRKGHNFERFVAKLFREHGYDKAMRNMEYQEGQGIDLNNTGIYDVQLKCGKKHASISKIKEVPLMDGRVPVLVTKADNEETYAVLPFSDFLRLIQK